MSVHAGNHICVQCLIRQGEGYKLMFLEVYYLSRNTKENVFQVIIIKYKNKMKFAIEMTCGRATKWIKIASWDHGEGWSKNNEYNVGSQFRYIMWRY